MKSVHYLAAMWIAFCLTGCGDPLVVRYDDTWSPQQRLAFRTFNDLVDHCSKAVEFTFIFDHYQKIRENRNASLDFVGRYIHQNSGNPDRTKFSDYGYSSSFFGSTDGKTVEVSGLNVEYRRNDEHFRLKNQHPRRVCDEISDDFTRKRAQILSCRRHACYRFHFRKKHEHFRLWNHDGGGYDTDSHFP